MIRAQAGNAGNTFYGVTAYIVFEIGVFCPELPL